MKQLDTSFSSSELTQIINIDSPSIETGDLLDLMVQKTQIKFSVHDELKPRRSTVIAKDIPLNLFMKSLSRTLNATWRKTNTVGNGVYEIYQTDAQKRSDVRQMLASEKREEVFRRGQREGILRQVKNAISQNDKNSKGLNDYLRTLSDSQLETAADSALEPPDIISASDQSHFHKHFFYPTSLSSLGSAQQSAIRDLLRSQGYADIGQNSQIGLIAAAGGFRMGVLEPDGKDVWVSPTVSIGNAAGMSDESGENDYDPNVVRLLGESSIVDLRTMSIVLRQKRIVVSPKINQRSLVEILKMISIQTGVRIVSDDFLNSRITHYVPVLPAKEHTLIDALQRIARAFAHRIVYSDGVLQLTTITRGLDLRLEPSIKTMRRLDALCLANEKTSENDYFLVGSCNLPQLRCIVRNHPIGLIKGGFLLRILRNYDFFSLITKLEANQKDLAFSKNGLEFTNLTNEQKKIFNTILVKGLPSKSLPNEQFKPLRIYIEHKTISPNIKTSTANFSVVLTGKGLQMPIRRFTLR
jgi:hypothetical protein